MSLKDGGHVYLTCSNCGERLADIWITRPDEEETWKLKAECCHCGDSSFNTEVKGGFHIGGIDNSIVSNFDFQGDVVLIKTIKGKVCES